uniref:MFS domain-containing protein n=1 Tax=Heterorhabditis bacteriophora TaxID=37862 RepID=A0A1I7XPH1_HETBA
MPSHTKLKYRQIGQGTEEDIRKRVGLVILVWKFEDLRRELEDKERSTTRDRRSKDTGSNNIKKPRFDEIAQGTGIDADEPLDEPDSSDDDSDEDDTVALMAELERIKKERAAEKTAKEEEEKRQEEKIRMDNIVSGNPLLNLTAGSGPTNGDHFKVKRRWDDDVVFKNCAKGIDERKKESTFINDAIRSEFHRKFMDNYGLYHSSRKTLSGVKASIKADWLDNNTHEPLFHSDADAKSFLGTLDAIFMTSYAAVKMFICFFALFFWGWLGDRLNPKYVVAVGMVGSAVTLTSFGTIPKLLDFYSVTYYVMMYALFGLIQACGWPSEIAIMANWFGKGNRGFIMGTWAACQPVGNIMGSVFTALILPLGYEYTFAFNSVLILIGALIVMVSIDSRPNEVAYQDLDIQESGIRVICHECEGEPISLVKAILLPGVLAYSLCNACLKLVNYAFFFWLPLYLTDAYQWKESEADQLSVWYDVGGIIGSVVGGYITDTLGCRTPLIVSMLSCSIGSLYMYAHIGRFCPVRPFFNIACFCYYNCVYTRISLLQYLTIITSILYICLLKV